MVQNTNLAEAIFVIFPTRCDWDVWHRAQRNVWASNLHHRSARCRFCRSFHLPSEEKGCDSATVEDNPISEKKSFTVVNCCFEALRGFVWIFVVILCFWWKPHDGGCTVSVGLGCSQVGLLGLLWFSAQSRLRRYWIEKLLSSAGRNISSATNSLDRNLMCNPSSSC